jgi:hypothetical protein
MGPVLFLLTKPTSLPTAQLVFGTNAQAIEKTSTDGDAPLPVTVFGSNPNPGTFYILQNWNSATSTIRLSTITGDIPAASWNTSSAVFPSGGSAYNTSPGEIAEQVGEPRKLSTNDARISSGVMVNGKIWCAHHVGISSTNVAVQWWQLNGEPELILEIFYKGGVLVTALTTTIAGFLPLQSTAARMSLSDIQFRQIHHW